MHDHEFPFRIASIVKGFRRDNEKRLANGFLRRPYSVEAAGMTDCQTSAWTC